MSELALQYSVLEADFSKIIPMSSLKKLGNFLGLTDDLESEELPREAEAPRIKVRETRSFASVQATPTAAVAAPAATNQIFTVNPRSYNEARVIGERYREGNTVLMNLTDMGAKYRDWETDRKSTRLNSSHLKLSRMPSSA